MRENSTRGYVRVTLEGSLDSQEAVDSVVIRRAPGGREDAFAIYRDDRSMFRPNKGSTYIVNVQCLHADSCVMLGC